MENSNKRKIINSCVIGAALILLITVLAGCSKGGAGNAEVAIANV